MGEDKLDFLTRNFQFEVMSFPDLVQRAFRPDADGKQEYVYLRSMGKNFRKDVSDFFETFPQLAGEFELPSCVPDFVRGERYFGSSLRISSKDTQLWTHYDVMDNLLCNVTGIKRVCLWPPDQAANLYVDPESSTSAVVDVETPDLEMFPKFEEAMKSCIQLVLRPGDMLYIPALWHHNVRALTPCLSVNIFWRHLDAGLYRGKDLYGNKDPAPAAEARKHFSNAISELEALPPSYRTLYMSQMIAQLEKAMYDMET